jgi:hypothetical protein
MSKQSDAISNQISIKLDEAIAVALKEVERLARKTMKRNPKSITGFCMAMGSACFYGEDGHSIGDFEPKLSEFYEFLDQHDRYLYLTGTPMRIKGKWDAPMQTDW